MSRLVVSPDSTMTSLLSSLSDKSESLVAEYLRCTRTTLEALLADPDVLKGVELQWIPGTYARNLLLGRGDLSVWAMTWSPGSQTSIHDHHCSCCFGVLQGTLTEIRYRAIDDTRVVEHQRHTREAGFIDCLVPSGPNIHQMVNEGPGEAISIHIYGYDHSLHPNSIRREYTVVPG